MVLSAINQACQSYYANLPRKIFPTIAKSAGYTFAAALFFSNRNVQGAIDISRPLLHAGIAALASAIHALMTPLFDQVFGKSNTGDVLSEFVKSSITGITASALVSYGMHSSIQLTAFKLYYLISLNTLTTWLAPSNTRTPMNDNSIYLCF